MPVSLQNNLNELDNLLADLNSARYTGGTADSASRSLISTTYAYGDYYSDLDSCLEDKPPERPPPPKSYSTKTSSKTTVTNGDYKSSNGDYKSSNGDYKSSNGGSLSTSPVPPIARIARRKPPKLMHVLKDGERRRVHDLAKEAREDINMDFQVPDDPCSTDYDYSYLSKGEHQDYGSVKQDYGSVTDYSSLGRREEYDYATLDSKHPPVVSEEELEKETGAGPRGDASMFVETDHGEVQSKYRYMGFGLWENTDPAAPKPKPRKPSPPPPPPKAEPVMYNCTVTVSKTVSSKELDDLVMADSFNSMYNRDVEVAEGIGDLGAGLGEPFEMFEKEDMSDMFKRAMLEQMQLVEDPPTKYQCVVCSEMIKGRIITAMGNKFHPQCFVCTYCRKEFKDRKYKTDPIEKKPYCFHCFEKLRGHYGTAHG